MEVNEGIGEVEIRVVDGPLASVRVVQVAGMAGPLVELEVGYEQTRLTTTETLALADQLPDLLRRAALRVEALQAQELTLRIPGQPS